MKIKSDDIRLGCAKGLLIVMIAFISIVLMQGIDWFIGIRERGISSSVMQEAVSNLRLGMNRQEAESLLIDAWNHRQCDYPELSIDLYLFGNRDTDLSAILALRFEKHEGSEILARIATIESHMLNSGNYSECIVVD